MSSNTCVRCGAPRRPGPDPRHEVCAYCNAVQPAPPVPPRAEIVAAVRDVMREDLDGDGVPDVLAPPRPEPQPELPSNARASHVLLLVGGGIAAMSSIGVVAALIVAPSPRMSPTKKETPVASAPSTTPQPSAAPSSTSAKTASTSELPAAPAKPVPKLTNEQYGKNIVAGRHKELLRCVEQDLLRNPSAPKAYTVTVLVESDGAPRNSATRFSPQPSPGFQVCARHAIFYGFTSSGRNPPQLVEFTFTTSFAFPNAKPAAKADPTWD